MEAAADQLISSFLSPKEKERGARESRYMYQEIMGRPSANSSGNGFMSKSASPFTMRDVVLSAYNDGFRQGALKAEVPVLNKKERKGKDSKDWSLVSEEHSANYADGFQAALGAARAT